MQQTKSETVTVQLTEVSSIHIKHLSITKSYPKIRFSDSAPNGRQDVVYPSSEIDPIIPTADFVAAADAFTKAVIETHLDGDLRQAYHWVLTSVEFIWLPDHSDIGYACTVGFYDLDDDLHCQIGFRQRSAAKVVSAIKAPLNALLDQCVLFAEGATAQGSLFDFLDSSVKEVK